MARPFLKWAGGKGQLLGQIRQRLPTELHEEQISRYAEPFVGGGAVFFLISGEFRISEFYISDKNADLILAYRTIQQQVDGLIERLEKIERQYLCLSEEHRKEFFYETRRLFNKGRRRNKCPNPNKYANLHVARLIFLNRTCFNGLYRVNSSGDFNVPYGNYQNPRICDASNLRSVSRSLQRAEIYCGDFTACKDFVDHRTFVYFDPPYRPISKTSSFNSYARNPFDDREQKRLALFFRVLDKNGAKLMLSNSDPQNENREDAFFDSLFSGYLIDKVIARRRINSNGDKRGEITELLITNYGKGHFDG